jgi:alanyl-tRNA synthetase
MGRIDLRVRDLHTGVMSLSSFEGEEAAAAWLSARPRFVEVLGVAALDFPRDVDARLRAALRPLDEEEKKLEQRLEATVAAVAAERKAEELKRTKAAEEAHKIAQATADPNRLMEVHWTYTGVLELTDPTDLRKITDEAREAVLAWVKERDEWVEGRGQVVGDAKVVVWPGPIPDKGGDRVKRGTFIPVTAPAKKET